jgi:hypothetical protein
MMPDMTLRMVLGLGFVGYVEDLPLVITELDESDEYKGWIMDGKWLTRKTPRLANIETT